MATTPPSAFFERAQKAAEDQSVWEPRIHTAEIIGTGFSFYGHELLSQIKDDASSDVLAVGIILKMAGDLVSGVTDLLRAKRFYAGAALMRQIVEIEYLMWAFNDGSVTPTKWLNSTHRERLKLFAPRVIRKTSRGRFLDKDYQGHCENGGHPVPIGMNFFGKGSESYSQLFLADMITHGWRIWDEFVKWAKRVARLPEMWLPSPPRSYLLR